MTAAKTWRCFHCGDVFRNPRHAASHFGIDELQTPGCVAVLRHGESHLLDRIRDMQERLHRYENDDSDIVRWANSKAADHAADLRAEEEKGYARGLRDAGYTGEQPMTAGLACNDAEAMRLWRECGLPEYFLGNGGTNHRLAAFAEACRRARAEPTEAQVEALRECRAFLADQLEVDLEACCPHNADGTRDESEMDELSRPMIEETKALLAKVDAALAGRGT